MKMNTQIARARSGETTADMTDAARREGIVAEDLARLVAAGRACPPTNASKTAPTGKAIGEGLSVKVNVNVGITDRASDFDEEIGKATMAVRLGADALMISRRARTRRPSAGNLSPRPAFPSERCRSTPPRPTPPRYRSSSSSASSRRRRATTASRS